ncbi:hypothetical protein LOK49_LG05G02221 [Camellia lanceoleosa]|uniref:Uncharacterized protein n=1 Tax=Camellia lanceoleosa TaxID=1840588 RepID=A0ACC0HTD0_9ERIC|nr:hypothetical protein LOK49_LG05G02221 [Camellia lanceoleosa]
MLNQEILTAFPKKSTSNGVNSGCKSMASLYRSLLNRMGQSDSWLTFKYEKLSNFCYDCGRLGHENHTCKFVSKEQGASLGYGPGLRTGSAGPTGLPIEHYRRKVDELEASMSPILTGQRTVGTPPPSSTPASDNPNQCPTSQPEQFLPRSSSSTQGTPMRTTPA